MDALKHIAQASMKTTVPQMEIGDTVKVYVRIKEGERERTQLFEG
ncbi:MAG: 50S ribosomal protein L19, partial [Oscillospiraceae bacterium]|nr:50S ribosomal protein L19 [Oscillospiraceae bacterium]